MGPTEENRRNGTCGTNLAGGEAGELPPPPSHVQPKPSYQEGRDQDTRFAPLVNPPLPPPHTPPLLPPMCRCVCVYAKKAMCIYTSSVSYTHRRVEIWGLDSWSERVYSLESSPKRYQQEGRTVSNGLDRYEPATDQQKLKVKQGDGVRIQHIEPAWLAATVDEWHGKDKPFKDRTDFIKRAELDLVEKCRAMYPDGYSTSTMAVAQAEIDRILGEYSQRSHAVDSIRSMWEQAITPDDERRAFEATRRMHASLVERGLSCSEIHDAVKRTYRDLLECPGDSDG